MSSEALGRGLRQEAVIPITERFGFESQSSTISFSDEHPPHFKLLGSARGRAENTSP